LQKPCVPTTVNMGAWASPKLLLIVPGARRPSGLSRASTTRLLKSAGGVCKPAYYPPTDKDYWWPPPVPTLFGSMESRPWPPTPPGNPSLIPGWRRPRPDVSIRVAVLPGKNITGFYLVVFARRYRPAPACRLPPAIVQPPRMVLCRRLLRAINPRQPSKLVILIFLRPAQRHCLRQPPSPLHPLRPVRRRPLRPV
jgi:hypothetical protein